MLRSLRVRLALWALLLLGVAQVIVSTILYVSISLWLQNQVDNNLLLTATQVASVLYDAEEPQNPLDTEDINLLFSEGNIAAQSFLRDQLFFVRLLDGSGGVIVATSTDDAIPIPAQALVGQARFDTVRFRDDAHDADMRLYSLPLDYAPQFVLQVGVSLEETREIQRDILKILALLLALMAVLAPASGWFLANRALIPIRAAVRTAAEINASDLTRRMDSAAAEIELEQLVQTFNAMLNRLETAFHRQRQFTADAAHELRTPLAIMQTGLEVTLSRERDAAEYRAALQTVSEEVQRLSQLTNTLLMLARADSGEAALVHQKVNLSLLLDIVADQCVALAGDKAITLERDIEAGLYVQGDEDRLIQVMLNLMDNAIKYTPPGGSVRVLARHQRSHVQVIIADSGPGIPESAQPYIFERFYRVNPARNQQGGFGLGLAIVKQTVDLHGGSIAVISQPGQGTQMVITLPIH